MEALILVVTLGGPAMFARIGVMRALNRNVERMFDTSREAGGYRGFRLLWRAKPADKPCRNRWQLQRINPIAFQAHMAFSITAAERGRPFTVNQHHQAAAVLASLR